MAIVFTDSSTGSSEEIHDTEITDAGKDISNLTHVFRQSIK